MKEAETKIVAFSIAIFMVLLIPIVSSADTAEVLPKGIFYFDTTYYHYFNIKKRFNPDGDAEPLATDLNANLDSTVFPGLAALDPLVGGHASIGSSKVDSTLFVRNFEFSFYYGITDKLSVGTLVPYFFLKNKVNAHLDPSTANVGKNPLFGSPSDPFGSPLIPLSFGGIPLNTNDVQELIGKGLDINGDGRIDIKGFGFKRVQPWSDNGLSDIELLAKYQFYKNNYWRLAFVGGVRLPTGQVDDPDNLVDLAFGDGQTDLIFRLHTDYIGIKKLVLNTTIRYDVQLPDKEVLRVPESVNRPLTAIKENVDRNLGDIIDFEVMGEYSFTDQLSGGLKYRFTKKFKDDVKGREGHISSLEDETDPTSHMFFASLGYSTIQKYLDKKFAVPFLAYLTYRNRFAGTNNVNKSQYISLSLTVLF